MQTKNYLVFIISIWSLISFVRCSSNDQQNNGYNPEPSSSLKVAPPSAITDKLTNLEGSEYIWGKEPCSGVNRSTFRAILLFLPKQVVRYVYTNVVISPDGQGKERQEIWEGTYQKNSQQITLHFTQITHLQKGFKDEQANQTQQEKVDKTLTFKSMVCEHNRSALQNLSELLDPMKGGNWVKK